MGFTTSLRVQMKDLRQDARLAWAELEMAREAFRSVVPRVVIVSPVHHTVYVLSVRRSGPLPQ